MGINRPDVRAILHWGMPQSLEQYFQVWMLHARVCSRLVHTPNITTVNPYCFRRLVLTPNIITVNPYRFRKLAEPVATAAPHNVCCLSI